MPPIAAYRSSTLSPKGDSPLWSPKGVVGFRVRVNINDNDGDWEMVCDDGLMMNIDGDGDIVVLRNDEH